ncbi:MAG: hypothetical protein EOP01_06800 [Propionibacteriaceae bacterium]|nr:MAG: hypothetical protein EOP01_06800 [Propionibacteriaceae bacterium]
MSTQPSTGRRRRRSVEPVRRAVSGHEVLQQVHRLQDLPAGTHPHLREAARQGLADRLLVWLVSTDGRPGILVTNPPTVAGSPS